MAFLFMGGMLRGQVIDTVLLAEQSFTELPFVYSTFASLLDREDRPYLYTAGVEYGARIYDISDPAAPVEELALWPASFAGLKPTNLCQVGDLLYVSLGGFQGVTQSAGLAVLDVSDPTNATVLGQWDSAAFSSGASIVRVRNGLAYLGAMDKGLVILDVNDPAAIAFLSAFVPDPAWPGLVSYPPNARGIDFKGDTVLLGYDAGALRAIDVSVPAQPVEVAHYLNPLQPAATADAYNNVRVVGDLCFVATDFCGFEVVDITDVSAMQQLAWVDPWNCNGGSWFGSDGHTNELITAAGDSLLFLSGADSEVLVYDISSPAQPTLVGGFIHPNDSAVAWGVDVRDSLVAVSYIDNSLVLFPPQPYYANKGGFQLLSWAMDLVTGSGAIGEAHLSAPWPNPTDGPLHVMGPVGAGIVVRDLLGVVHRRGRMGLAVEEIDLTGLGAGLYVVELLTARGGAAFRVVLR